MQKFLTYLLFFIGVISISYSAILRNVPQTIQQPNGKTIKCFASGDEFCNWLHDIDGYTIVRDNVTNYYCYAIKKNDKIISSGIIIGERNPKEIGLVPNLIPKADSSKKSEPPKPIIQKINIKKKDKNKLLTNNIGTIENIAIFIRFSDEDEYTNELTKYKTLFNNEDNNSLKNYFREVSYNQLEVNSTFYPTPPGDKVISYQDIMPRNYYIRYDPINNPIGFNSENKKNREDSLLFRAINFVSNQISEDIIIDNDNDGTVDNICFIISGSPEGWNELLWPHKGDLWLESNINNKRVWSYNIQLNSYLSTGVLSHEFFHSLGAPDLYSYYTIAEIVDIWDLMGNQTEPPQHTSAFMKWKYGFWLNEIPKINNSGYYTLKPLSTSQANNCYILFSPKNSDEYFVFEYRKAEGIYESSLPGSGLLVYRINMNASNGNGNGPPYEAYIYRPDGTPQNPYNGNIRNAIFNADSLRTVFNENSNPSPFLSDGSFGGIDVSKISTAGDSITFYYNNPDDISASSYFYYSSIDTYQEITDGTIYGDTNNDDESFNNINIGYNFNFRGINFTKIGINTNGFIVLGGIANNTFYAISDSINYNVISALSNDLQAQENSSILTQITGEFPNRIFTIQWKNYRSKNQSGDNYNFQIKLFETKNSIEIVYGNFDKNDENQNLQVGLRGSSTNDYYNRTNNSVQNNWSNSISGNSNIASCLLSSICKPNSGLKYIWEKSIKPILTSPANYMINLPIQPTLVWKSNNLVDSFQIQISTNATFSTTTLNISGYADTILTLSKTQVIENNRTYYWRVRALNSNENSDWSTIWSFKTMNPLVASSWICQNPLPTGNTLWTVCFVNKNYGWVGGIGTICNTINGGKSWQTLISPTEKFINDIYFLNENNGWIACTERIYKTTDGGISWTIQLDDLDSKFVKIVFKNDTVGWTIANKGFNVEIQKTTDGGNTWLSQYSRQGENYQDMCFLNEVTGWAVGGVVDPIAPKILKTTDGGSNWIEQQCLSNEPMQSVYFTNANFGWAVGNLHYINQNDWNNNLYRTTDGGENWISFSNAIPNSNNGRKVFFHDAENGWLFGQGSYLYKTSDGGISWNVAPCLKRYERGIHFVDTEVAYFLGDWGRIEKTTDGGSSWSEQTSGFRKPIWDVCFINSSTGWVVGNSGKILKTTNGGLNWGQIPSTLQKDLYGVHFINSDVGWVVGWGLPIYKSTDGGINWFSQNSNREYLKDIFFINKNTGWAVGNSGKILKTTNSGGNWVNLNGNTTKNLKKICFVDENNGWIVGGMDTQSGIILKTTNGGNNWSSKEIDSRNGLYGVHFIDSLNGWASGDKIMLQTNDGGITWTSSNMPRSMNSVYFLNSSFGISAGQSGYIFKTIDSGMSWVKESTIIDNDLESIQILDNKTAWVIGQGGNIYRYYGIVIPTLSTTALTSITYNSASSGGNITDDGGASITARGVCWSTTQNPTTSNSKTTDGTDTGSFSSSITGLSPNTKYYVRAYATNSIGTAYGEQIEFKTKKADTILIALFSGWNMISSNIIPQKPDLMQNITSSITGNLVIAKNNIGAAFIPKYEINDIGKWDVTQGYQVYMSYADTLVVTGLAVNPSDTQIALYQGWNIISYLRNSEIDCETAFASLTDDNNLIIVKDNYGNVYIPAYGINTIGNLIPGQGYQIYVLNTDVLVYPGN
jgi:M6 family metalloprotease-like protein